MERPPNATAAPTIICRRVGPLASIPRLLLSLIIASWIVTLGPPLTVAHSVPIEARGQNRFKVAGAQRLNFRLADCASTGLLPIGRKFCPNRPNPGADSACSEV